MNRTEYGSVLDSLKAERQRITQLIESFERYLEDSTAGTSKPNEANVILKQPKAVRTKASTPAVKPQTTDAVESLTINDAVMRAVQEAPRTIAEVCDRLAIIRPGTNRPSAYAATQKLFRDGTLVKDEMLKLHVVA